MKPSLSRLTTATTRAVGVILSAESLENQVIIDLQPALPIAPEPVSYDAGVAYGANFVVWRHEGGCMVVDILFNQRPLLKKASNRSS